jgi:hypothetical protein
VNCVCVLAGLTNQDGYEDMGMRGLCSAHLLDCRRRCLLILFHLAASRQLAQGDVSVPHWFTVDASVDPLVYLINIDIVARLCLCLAPLAGIQLAAALALPMHIHECMRYRCTETESETIQS